MTASVFSAVSMVLVSPTLVVEWLRIGPHPTAPRDELQTAIISDQFVLHYQPKIDLDTGDVLADSSVGLVSGVR